MNKRKIISIVLCILCCFMVFVNAMSMFPLELEYGSRGFYHLYMCICKMLVYLAIIYYALFAYKKPHGNHLRYIILVCAFLTLLETLVPSSSDKPNAIFVVNYVINFLVAILVSFVSGRLDRNKENKTILIVVLGLIAVSTILAISIKPDFIGQGLGQVPEGLATAGPVPEGPGPDGSPISSVAKTFSFFDMLIQYGLIMAAYLFRYSSHKEAGLMDKAEN